MSDHMAAEIGIGGKVPISLVPDLCAAIAQERISRTWGDGNFRPESEEELTEAFTENDDGLRLLWLCDDEACYGEFGALEAFLEKHRIPFRRRREGMCEHEPLIVEYRPETGVLAFHADNAGRAVIPVDGFRPVEKILAEAVDQDRNSSGETMALVEAALKLLREHLPPSVPPLEPFEITWE